MLRFNCASCQYLPTLLNMATSSMSPEPRTKSTAPNSSNDFDSESTRCLVSEKRALSDIIGAQYPPFDADARVARPFAEEAARDAAFEEGKLVNVFLR